ncbi:FAD-dependent oxidoreductase [Vibrio sp. WXL210]|uniref:FAD-dependent oxidoreductase n=1 Tax=Vibrio sp. WXL210 TaxID=3450709 RepID=UPI003EC6ECAB
MKFRERVIDKDLVIVGAGFPGICAAIQAARKGVKVALINDRGVLGGNTSAEIGVSVDGACDGGKLNLNSREGGICSEILTEYQNRTPIKRSRYTFDGVLIDFINREKNIEVFLNTCVDEAQTDGNTIVSVSGTQNTTETRYHFNAKWFIDDTGDGALGAMSGAEFMLGREGAKTFDENIAPEEADKYVIPSTLTFHAFDAGHEVPFKAPETAFNLAESDVLDRRIIPKDSFDLFKWYYEIGGEYDHVFDREQIIRDHKSLVWGIWDHIKNSGEYPGSENYDIEYMACIPGTREYRRLVGDYILTEKDIIIQPDHVDTVGHGGWNIDLHAIKGFFDEDLVNKHINFNGIYQIPYRCGYSKNVSNLFMCGRCMSTSHVAFGSARVTATLSTLGQAVGMAAALCHKYDCNPRDIYTDHLEELQQELLNADQYIVGKQRKDATDIAPQAKVTASSHAALGYNEPIEVDLEKVLTDSGLKHLIPKVRELKEQESQTTEVGPSFQKVMYELYKGFDSDKRLDENLALSIPVVEKLDQVEILLRAKANTALEYNIYLPEKAENYGPDQCVFSGKVNVDKNDNFVWVTLPADIKIEQRYVLVELVTNTDIALAIGGREQPTGIMFRSKENFAENEVDYKTLEMSPKVWQRAPLTACYRTTPAQDVYQADNVINGFNRPYGLPHLWLADKADAQPYVELEWDSEVDISQIELVFAADLTRRIEYENFNSTLDYIAQSYRISYLDNDEFKPVVSVEGNYQKCVKHAIEPVSTRKIRVELLSSMNDQVGLYEVKVRG